MARWLGVRLARPRVPVRRSQDVAWLITGPLFVIALVLTLPVILGRLKQHEPVFGNLVLGLILFAMFVVAEAAHLHVEVRRQVYIMSPVEIPMLLALFYLPPLTVVAVRVLANAVIQVALRRGLVKGSFNFAAVSAGIALANLIVFTWRPLPDTAPRTWLVLVVAVLANVALTGLAVGGVITLVQGRSYLRQVGKAVVLSMAVNAVTLNVGLIMLLALQQSNWAIPILIGLAIVIVIVYRAYAQFQRQHNSLTELYDLTRAMTATGYDGTLPDVLLARVRELLRAESATLWLPAHGRYPEVLLSARVDYPGLLDSAATPDPLRRMAMDTGETVAACPKLGTEDLRDLLRLNGIKDAIVVPLRSGAAVIGTLEAAGRLGDNNYFGADDVRLLETLAAHAAFAVENSRLVDRLRFDANHDALTGLPNRRRLHAAIEESVAVLAARRGDSCGDAGTDGARHVDRRHRYDGWCRRTSGSWCGTRDAAAARGRRHACCQVGQLSGAAVQPGPGVQVGAPPGPRRGPASHPRRRRAGGVLPAQAGAVRPPGCRRGVPGPLGAPGPWLGLAGGLRRGRRAHRPACAAHRDRAARRLAARTALDRLGRPAVGRGQPLSAYAPGPDLPRPGRAAAGGVRRGGGMAHAGDHRGRHGGRRQPSAADPATVARSGRTPSGRRLRHRVLLAGLPAAPAGPRGEGGPYLCAGHGDRPRRPGDRTGDRRSFPSFRAQCGRRGCGERADAGPARRDRLRLRAGLPVQPAAAVRTSGSLAAGPDGGGVDRGRRGALATRGALASATPALPQRSFQRSSRCQSGPA